MLKNLLFYRLTIFNAITLCAIFFAFQMGIVGDLVKHDAYGVTYGIAALLGLAMAGSLSRGWKVSQARNFFNDKMGWVAGEKNAFKLKVSKMPYKSAYLQYMAAWAVLIGLLGNVLGLVHAVASNDDAIIRAGVSVAFGSTAIGIFAALIIEINFVMLWVATSLLNEDVKAQ